LFILFFFSSDAIEDDDVENEDDSPSKKTKGKSGRKQGQKPKTNLQEAENENGIDNKYFSFFKKINLSNFRTKR